MSLSAPRNTRRAGEGAVELLQSYPVAASKEIYEGSLVALDSSGNAVPGGDATAVHMVGVAEETVDNSAGLAGALSVAVRAGTFKLKSSGATGDVVAAANVPCAVYATDDYIVALTPGAAANRALAGVAVQIDDDGSPMVEVRPSIGIAAEAYSPGATGDWATSLPKTKSEALNRLAKAVKAGTTGAIGT